MTPEEDARRVKGITGRVARGPFGAGSKSERPAIWIETDDGRYVLRRKEGPAIGDKLLDAYVGHCIRCDGVLLSHTLIAESIEIVNS